MSMSPRTSRQSSRSVAVKTETSSNQSGKQTSNLPKKLQPYEVRDIGGSSLPKLLNAMLTDQLINPNSGSVRHLPALFFSDDKGLRMWSKITHLPSYYQTRDEIELLETHGEDIVAQLRADCKQAEGMMLIDLGAGDIRKIVPLLERLDRLNLPISYYALDLSSTSLSAAMAKLSAQSFANISCHGLWGCFDSGLEFIGTLPANIPRVFLSLGSMFGNDFPTPAISLLKNWRTEMRHIDRMLIGMDGTTDPKDIWSSYHDESGQFDRFIRNGMKFSNEVLGVKWFDNKDWDLEGVLVNEPWTMHKFVFKAKRDVTIPTESANILLTEGEIIEGYRAFKLGVDEMKRRFTDAGLEECCNGWKSATGRISKFSLFSLANVAQSPSTSGRTQAY